MIALGQSRSLNDIGNGDIIGSTLERCYVKTELLGFTTKHWKGGDARKAWVNQGSPSNPGRLNDLRHIIFKSADDNLEKQEEFWNYVKRRPIENVDEALAWAHQRLVNEMKKKNFNCNFGWSSS